jgi:hypothetical protein
MKEEYLTISVFPLAEAISKLIQSNCVSRTYFKTTEKYFFD